MLVETRSQSVDRSNAVDESTSDRERHVDVDGQHGPVCVDDEHYHLRHQQQQQQQLELADAWSVRRRWSHG